MSHRAARVVYWVSLSFAIIVAIVALKAHWNLTFFGYRLGGVSIELYLLHLRNALVALPVLLVWLQISRRPGVRHTIVAGARWWLRSRVAVALGLFLFLLAAVVTARIAYKGMPIGDAIWVMFQAKIFAAGRLYAPAPRYPDFFTANWIIHDGKWFSYTSPGHSVMLLPALLVGAAWLVGPVLTTLAIWGLWRLGTRLLGRRQGRLVLLLAITSPCLIFLAGTHDFHVSSLLFTVLSLLLISQTTSKDRSSEVRSSKNDEQRTMGWRLALAGLCLGMVFLARPYTAVAVGVPLILFVALRRTGKLLPFLLAGASLVLVHLLYNRAMTGSLLVFPYNIMGKFVGIGFAPDFGGPGYGIQGHTLLRALINTGYGLVVTSLQASGWLFFSLAFVVLAAIRFFRADRHSPDQTRQLRRMWWVWLSGLGPIIAYFFYWPHGITPWGAKYWTEALPAILLLSAVGIRTSRSLLPQKLGVRRDFVLRILAFFLVYDLAVALPTTFEYLRENKWGETPKVGNRIRAAGLHHALVFVYTDERSGAADYTSAFLLNDPFLKGDVIYARDLGAAEDARLMALYPDRRAYIYDFNDETIQPIP